MALRNLISKTFLPNFEKDIARIMKKEVDSVIPMLDSMMAPQVYGFSGRSASTGAYQSSGFRASTMSAAPLKKVEYSIKQRGLFE